jgi:threonine/homoserine/homoserine lactone efflux protein
VLNILANLVSVGLAGAMSTVPVSVTIMILLSPNPRRGALPFLIDSIAGSILVVGLSTVGLRFLPVRPELGQDVLLAWLGLLIGAALIVYAVYLFRRRSQTDGATLGKIKTRIQSARPWEFLALGLVLNLRPKAILLAVTAGALISVREPPPVQGTLLVLAYAAVAQSAVVVPIAIWLRSRSVPRGRLLPGRSLSDCQGYFR